MHNKKLFLSIGEGAWNIVFRCDWKPIRFVMAFVLFGAAYVQRGFSELASDKFFVHFAYNAASVLSMLFGFFYIYVSTLKSKLHDEEAAKKRYYVELAAVVIWITVFYLDIYCYSKKIITMDFVSWEHHVITNCIVSLTLLLAYLNAISLPEKIRIQKTVERQYAEFTNNRHYSNG